MGKKISENPKAVEARARKEGAKKGAADGKPGAACTLCWQLHAKKSQQVQTSQFAAPC